MPLLAEVSGIPLLVRGPLSSAEASSALFCWLGVRKRLDGSELDGSEHFEKIVKISLELLGLLLELLLELLLLLLYAFIT